MTSRHHPWPFALVLASVCMISCNSGEKARNDAGADGASTATGYCDPGKCNASCLRIQEREGRCSLEDQCECIGGADGDADGDTDADADADNCRYYDGKVPCETDQDCGGTEVGCVCPRLEGEKEITSYCYASCNEKFPCPDWNQTCMNTSADSDHGI